MKTIWNIKTGDNMQNQIKFLLLILTFLSSANLFAQFAGEDKRIARQSNNTQTVVIGSPSNNPQDCYKWTGGIILSDDNLPQVTVNPRDSVTIFICTRVSKYGVEQDQVKVYVVDDIHIISVTPKRKCWATNESVLISEFEIVTDPPGMSSAVRLGANSSPANGGFATKVSNMSVTFEAVVENRVTDNATASIVVVNKDVNTSVGYSTEVDVVRNLRAGILKKGRFIATKLRNSPLKVPCEFEAPQVEVGGSIQYFNECCHDKVQDSEKFGLSGGLSGGGISCDFQFPPPYGGIPKIAELGVTLKVGIAANLNMDLTTSECQTEACIELALAGSLTVGFYGQIWDKDVLRAELTATGSLAFASVKLCYPSGMTFGLVCFEAKGNFSVKLFSFTVYAGEVVLIEKTCLAGS